MEFQLRKKEEKQERERKNYSSPFVSLLGVFLQLKVRREEAEDDIYTDVGMPKNENTLGKLYFLFQKHGYFGNLRQYFS